MFRRSLGGEGGRFHYQTLGASSLEWQLCVVLWVIKDGVDILSDEARVQP